jgi:hypothetical protein
MQPVLLGLAIAVMVIVLVNFATRVLESPRHGRWTSCVLFGSCAAGFGAGVFVEERPSLRLAYAVLSGFLVYAALATALHWPGFQPQPPQDQDEDKDEDDGGDV